VFPGHGWTPRGGVHLMIVFDLKCEGSGHVFEAWFGSSADYESQRERGLVACPICGDGRIGFPSPPRAGPSPPCRSGEAPADSEAMKAMLSAMATAQKEMLEKSSYVGDRFADEARAIHLGEAAARSIHGKATRAQTESLIEEGIEVSPLPFPVVEPGEEN
jgi:hypothetical protein